MRTGTAIFLLIFSICAHAIEPNIECFRKEYLDYTGTMKQFWSSVDSEFKEKYPELHQEFSYLIKEKKAYNRMLEISLDYIIKNHPEELKMGGSVFAMVPLHKRYRDPIYRELRRIPEFTKLHFEVESYKLVNKMPDFERLNKAISVMYEIDKIPSIHLAFKRATDKGEIPIENLKCDHK